MIPGPSCFKQAADDMRIMQASTSVLKGGSLAALDLRSINPNLFRPQSWAEITAGQVSHGLPNYPPY